MTNYCSDEKILNFLMIKKDPFKLIVQLFSSITLYWLLRVMNCVYVNMKIIEISHKLIYF